MVGACLLAGCGGGGGVASDGQAAADEPPDVEPATRPHFAGGLEVVLQTGRIAYNEDACQSMDEDRVCDVSGAREYLLLGEPGTGRLVEARMDPSNGNTAWTATVSFSPETAGRLRAFRELARETGAMVLVLTAAREVLLMAPVPRIEGRRLTYPGLEKPEAWDLVERIAGPPGPA